MLNSKHNCLKQYDYSIHAPSFYTKKASFAMRCCALLMIMLLIPINSHSQNDENKSIEPKIVNVIEEAEVTFKLSIKSATYGNATLGRFINTFTKTDTGYTVNSVTKAQGIAAIMIGSNEQQSCDFTFNHSTNTATPVNLSLIHI